MHDENEDDEIHTPFEEAYCMIQMAIMILMMEMQRRLSLHHRRVFLSSHQHSKRQILPFKTSPKS